MTTTPDLGRWLRWLTLLMWAVVGWAMVVEAHLREGAVLPSCAVSWGAAFVVCGLTFFLLCGERPSRWPRWTWITVLALEAGSVLFMIAWWSSLMGGFLLVFGAWQAARVLSFHASLAWVAGQTVVLALVMAGQEPSLARLVVASVYGGLQLFALLLAHLVRNEQSARVRLAQAYSELRGAQELLGRASRSAERLRVARELHDGMGHSLTALSLALESAQHELAEPPAGLVKARRLASGLLAELRQVVGRLREEPTPDIAGQLREMVAEIERPHIELELVGECSRLDALKAHALLRCAQELVTNAIKHSGAGNAWVTLECSGAGQRLVVRDDGRGAAALAEGHGLRGIRERVGAFGGRLELATRPGAFVASVTIPAPGDAG